MIIRLVSIFLAAFPLALDSVHKTNFGMGKTNFGLGCEHMPARDRFDLSGVAVGDFIAYTPFYLEEVPQDKRKPFYVARVLALKETAVRVQLYRTDTKGLSMLNTSHRVVYTYFLGPHHIRDVAAEDIITTCELTIKKDKLTAKSKRKIHLLLDEKVLDAMHGTHRDRFDLSRVAVGDLNPETVLR